MQKVKNGKKYETRICVVCGKEFEVRADSKTTHCSSKCSHEHLKKEKKYCLVCGKELEHRRNKCCSNKCAGILKRKFETRKCEWCGCEVTKNRTQFGKRTFCSKYCLAKWQSENTRGENSSRWKGGKIDQNGYWFIKQPDGSYKQEHIIVAEKTLGRILEKDEVVHHINKNKKDNRPDNLTVLSRKEHIRIHKNDLFDAKG